MAGCRVLARGPAPVSRPLRYRASRAGPQPFVSLSPLTNALSRAVALCSPENTSVVSPGHRALLVTLGVDAQCYRELLAVEVRVALLG